MQPYRFAFAALILVAFIHPLTGFGQDDTSAPPDTTGPWDLKGQVTLNFQQVAVSNWVGGGQNTIAVGGLFSLGADLVDGENDWRNSLELGYGATKLARQGFRKSDDRIALISRYGHRATEHLLYSALLDFRTQFDQGYDYDSIAVDGEPLLISNVLAPAYLNVGIGGTWRPQEWIELFVAPLSNRLTLVLHDSLSNRGAHGVDRGEYISSDLGATSTLTIEKEIMKNVLVKTRLYLFGPYDRIDKLIISWNTLVNLKVNDIISVGLAADLFYDHDVEIVRDDGTTGPTTQFRNTLNVGIGYAF